MHLKLEILRFNQIISCFLLFCAIGHSLNAQIGNVIGTELASPEIVIKSATDNIVLDGVLDEATWKSAQKANKFSQYFPSDTVLACGETEVLFAYDDENFYIGAICYTAGNDFLVESLRRDYGFGSNDNISFMLDTYNDKTNAYLFGMNPYGARREALISNGGKTFDSFDSSWDNKWDGASKRYDNYWICELKIPFKSIRYKEGKTKWRFNSYRNDAQCNEITAYINIPREYVLMDLQYTAELAWEEPLDKPGTNISLIPYVSGGIIRDFEDTDETSATRNFAVGGDAKIGITSSLNLDLTVNPDFSQVEVDRQVTNLDRFEIFFPERRQFFLENADLFSSFGTGRSNPFFSRRIGISSDTVTGNTIQNQIYGGARLTGKLNEDLRVGLISLQTAAQQENDLPSINYSIFAAEQKVQERSNIGVIFVNKQSVNTEGFGNTVDKFDRVAGVEYRLRSADNFWSGKVSYLQAITPNDEKQKFSHFATLDYNSKNYRVSWSHLLVGNGFDAEVGFVPRRDILVLNPSFAYRIFTEGKKINNHTLSISPRLFYKLGQDDNLIIPDAAVEQIELGLDWRMSFANTARMNVNFFTQNFTLLDDFDPTRIQEDDVFVRAGAQVTNTSLSLSYNADRRNKLTYRINPSIESFYGGLRAGVGGQVQYRVQPFGNIGVQYNYNHINIGDNFEVANLFLIGPRIDLTFTKKLFWTTFIQYNNQTDNLNFNSRFQWRFAPVSDFFLVYTDNYNTEQFDNLFSRNRALVAKLTYWLNP